MIKVACEGSFSVFLQQVIMGSWYVSEILQRFGISHFVQAFQEESCTFLTQPPKCFIVFVREGSVFVRLKEDIHGGRSSQK